MDIHVHIRFRSLIGRSSKNTPNAELFVRRAYNSHVQKIVRDILLAKNGTSDDHLQSIEAVIGRSINFTKKEIEEWCKSRKWGDANFQSNEDREKIIENCTKKLPEFAVNEYSINKELWPRIAEIITELSNRKKDDITEYLWIKLTQKREEVDLSFIK